MTLGRLHESAESRLRLDGVRLPPNRTVSCYGIFEGGTIGNLFTSFFVADFKGRRMLMARNDDILNGIYRTSYFVLDQVR